MTERIFKLIDGVTVLLTSRGATEETPLVHDDMNHVYFGRLVKRTQVWRYYKLLANGLTLRVDPKGGIVHWRIPHPQRALFSEADTSACVGSLSGARPLIYIGEPQGNE